MLLASGTTILGIIVAVIVLTLILIAMSLKIVPQAQAYVVEKLGSYHKTFRCSLGMANNL